MFGHARRSDFWNARSDLSAAFNIEPCCHPCWGGVLIIVLTGVSSAQRGLDPRLISSTPTGVGTNHPSLTFNDRWTTSSVLKKGDWHVAATVSCGDCDCRSEPVPVFQRPAERHLGAGRATVYLARELIWELVCESRSPVE